MDVPCGFLVLDKTSGPTSHGCVALVRRAYGLRRVGHGGTLDPAVTGVLPIAVGAATRLLPYLPGEKAYHGCIQLGLRTHSDDLQGTVLEHAPVPSLTAAQLQALLEPFRGSIQQRPPQVSAVHVDGQRAYQRVREGQELQLPPRPVVIAALDLLAWDPAQQRLEIAVRCSAGTYIRALARDLGEALGCGGCLAWLRRTEALGFDLSAAVPMDRLEAAITGAQPLPPLLDPRHALQHLPQVQLTAEEQSGWRCGRPFAAGQRLQGPAEAVVVLHPDGSLAGMAQADGAALLQPRLVLQAAG